MLNIPTQLQRRDDPVQVGIIGAGLFGTKLTDQLARVPGLVPAAIADIDIEKAKTAFAEADVAGAVTEADSAEDADAAIERGEHAVLTDGTALAATDVDVVVEATGVPNAGARHAYTAITEGKHVVNVTVETDTVVGPELAALAADHGVTYSYAYGDQPALMVELYDWARTIGMDVVAVGRGSMYVDEYRLGTPDDVFERFGYDDDFAEAYDLNARMYNSFLDGTKIAVETCALANATGLQPDVPGMHIPTAEVTEVPEKLRPKADGGLLEGTGVVETTSSQYPDGSTTAYDLSWSVFVVTRVPNPAVREYLVQNADHGFHVANDGKYAFFYRPYHLPGIETPVSVASAALRNEPTGAPRGHHAEVVGAAKRDLEPGTELDGGGGYTVYGVLETADRAADRTHVPFELLDGATVTDPVSRDDVLTYDAVSLEDSFIRRLREAPDEATP
jgi:predicted homoserine dehydrogenase-like protein